MKTLSARAVNPCPRGRGRPIRHLSLDEHRDRPEGRKNERGTSTIGRRPHFSFWEGMAVAGPDQSQRDGDTLTVFAIAEIYAMYLDFDGKGEPFELL
jgi:hypothetical protein